MNTPNYLSTLDIIRQLNEYAGEAEALITQEQQRFQVARKRLEEERETVTRQLSQNLFAKKKLVNDKARAIQAEAQGIRAHILKLDETLTGADKYYGKTKRKREQQLAEARSSQYGQDGDYVAAMQTIREECSRLSKKYAEHILPAVINGINYLFSAQRKRDYEELITLKHTVDALLAELGGFLPEVTGESVSALEESFASQSAMQDAGFAARFQQLEDQRIAAMDAVAAAVCNRLDEILPDSLVCALATAAAEYEEGFCRVHTSQELGESVVLGYVGYPLSLYVGSPLLASLIADKCALLSQGDGALRFPLICPQGYPLAWLIMHDGSALPAVQQLTHQIMLELLSRVPVTRLTITAFDPENRGNSISAFFDLRAKLPDLFDTQVYIHRDEVLRKINQINEYIDSTLQYSLGNRYTSVFHLARENPDHHPKVRLLLLYDFPKGFDEQSLAGLRNILRHGHRCGVYTVICQDTRLTQRELPESASSLSEMCSIIQQSGPDITMRGLPLSFPEFPGAHSLAKLSNKYLLIYEGIRNRGLAFPPVIKRLMDAGGKAEAGEHIERVRALLRDNAGRKYTPNSEQRFPETIPIGTVEYPLDIFSDSACYEEIRSAFALGGPGEEEVGRAGLPLTCELGGSFHLLLQSPEACQEQMQRLTHHIIWTFLASVPVTKLNVCVFDAERRGNSVHPFLEFRKRLPGLFDGEIHTSQDSITARLGRLNSAIDELTQDKLGSRYKNLMEYNATAPSRAEPVTLLVVYDFPRGFDSRSVEQLLNILKNGNRCGIFAVLCHNPDIAVPRYDNMGERMEELGRYCANVAWQDRGYTLMPYSIPVNIGPCPQGSEADRFAEDYAAISEELGRRGLSFRDILPPQFHSGDSSKNLTIPIGIGDGETVVKLVLGEGSSHHGLIAGATGSGKSTLLHTLITSCLLNYSPDQLHLYLMDFKSGTEFKVYESVKLPHIQLLALDAMQEFGESILENLVSEMTRRSDLFKGAGQTSLAGYKQATGQPLPRILVIMDEFQILYNDSANRKVAMNCAELTKRIATEGRAFGIHLLMATQTTKNFMDLTLTHGSIEQMRVRIGLKCGEDDARYLFGDHGDRRALEMMKGPIGTAVMNLEYMESDSVGLRAAYVDKEAQAGYLEQVAETFQDMPYTLQTFEGSRTVDLLDHLREQGMLGSEASAVIPVGTLIKVAPPLHLTVDRRRRQNLLICGASETMSENILNNYILCALLNGGARMYCADGDYLVGEGGSAEFYRCLACFGDRFTLATDRGGILRAVSEVYQLYQERKKGAGGGPVFLLFRQLQFLDIVLKMLRDEWVDESEFSPAPPVVEEAPEERDEDDTGGFFPFLKDFESSFDRREEQAAQAAAKEPDISKKLLRLIDEGSGYGITIVVGSGEYQCVKESMYFGERTLQKFPQRIVYSLSDMEADNLIENVSISALRSNTVYYTDGVRQTFQLKPYRMPAPQELKSFLDSRQGEVVS